YPGGETVFRLDGMEFGAQIADDGQSCVFEPEVRQRVDWPERIIEEPVAVINPTQPGHSQKVLLGQHFVPKRVNHLGLGKKAVSAKIEVIIFVFYGLADATRGAVFFENQYSPVVFYQFISRSKPCRPSADYHHVVFLCASHFILLFWKEPRGE